MRLDQAPFNDERVRRAMALAMDQDAIIRTVYRGNGSIRTNLPWLAAFETEPGRDTYGPLASPNVAEAKKLLADAGFPNGFDAKLEWTQYGANDPDLLQLVQAELAMAGIKITLDKQEYVNFIGKWYSGKFDQLALGFIATFPQDWTTMTYLTRHSGKGQNVWNINDPEMDRLTEELKANAGSIDKQRPTFRKLWDLEVSKEYFIPLPDPPADSAWKAYVHNWEISDRTQMPDWGGRQFEIIWTDKK
jgi:ABC-type transport system substrate-binding protein